MKICYILLVCITTIRQQSLVYCARILCAFPTPSFSHQYVFRAYTQELVKRGHELVIITTDPARTNERFLNNVTEIDVGIAYEVLKESYKIIEKTHTVERGVIMDEEMMTSVLFSSWNKIMTDQLKYEKVKKILNNRNEHFDLIVIEAWIESFLILTNLFKAPVIAISSLYGTPENYGALGAVTRHPRLYPHWFRSNFDSNTLWEEIKNLYYEIKFMYVSKEQEAKQNIFFKAEYGPNASTIHELRNNIDLLFVNANPIYDNNRPVPPSVVYLGALHLQPPKVIPQDFKTYLDNSKRGVIYVSLGTNVRPNKMDKDLVEAFVNALGSLPYDILWKFDTDLLQMKPSNVEIRKWFPQRDILLHPKVNLFVTQGGLQSTDETIDAAVPIVCIPFLADQWYNCHRSAELGIGKTVNPKTMTAKDLSTAITSVLQNESYKNNVEKVRALINDQPQTPMERAIWWTEYLIRHGGARHLRAATANLSWSEYLMLDVLVPIVISFVVVLALLVKIIRILNILVSTIKYHINFGYSKNKDV